MEKINIPVGVSDFFEIRQNNYYYVDKSYFIREILRTPATKVTLIHKYTQKNIRMMTTKSFATEFPSLKNDVR